MADTRLNSLNATTSLSATDIMLVEQDSGGYQSKKVTAQNLYRNVLDGSESEPGLAFSGDQDSGFYRIGANNIGLSLNGSKVADFGTGGFSLTGAFTASGLSTFNGGIVVSSTTAPIYQRDTNATTDEKNWLQWLQAGNWILSTATDADPTVNVNNAISIQRTGTTVDEVEVNATNIDINGNADISGTLNVGGDLSGAIAQDNATISSGTITVTSTASIVVLTIGTEGAAATDDLDTITTTTSPQILICRSASSSQDITFKDGTDNLSIAGDFTTTRSDDIITLINIAGTVYEMSRSDNRV